MRGPILPHLRIFIVIIVSVEKGNLIYKIICHFTVGSPASESSSDPALEWWAVIWCNKLKGRECQCFPLLFNLFSFQSEREVSLLWASVIDVVIVSPAPAETVCRRCYFIPLACSCPSPSRTICSEEFILRTGHLIYNCEIHCGGVWINKVLIF